MALYDNVLLCMFVYGRVWHVLVCRAMYGCVRLCMFIYDCGCSSVDGFLITLTSGSL